MIATAPSGPPAAAPEVVVPLLNKIMSFARSPQGQRLLSEAQRRAKDPRTQQQVRDAARRFMSSRQKPR
jgi:hypothetical protein